MTDNDIELEIKVITKFLNSAKRDRYVSFVQNGKNRPKFLKDLSKTDFLNQNLFESMNGNESEIIKNRIKSIGNINDCYVISENKNIDQKRMSIESALTETIGADQGTLLVFGNAEIVYSESEGFNNRWISKKKKINGTEEQEARNHRC
ncbi:hypothetical protein QRD02_14260 [Aequorivita sp. SDUM287046]|uniref:Uncharacterized protein n=1 Tax=Aequorivita aurantiaca TaxID=3053356 RepID=A0ABT8DNU3_9FLAO|nr:hypothetical protein [Aequorivita aurantiaca]MDN3725545.1 hypothetical protein [Aequorivita aurantiaca]